MKKIILLFSIVFATSCATNTSFNTFYQNHEEDSEFSFGFSSSLIANFLPDEDLEDIKPLLKKAKHVRILIFSENTPDKAQKFSKFINRSKFEKVVKLKSDNDKLAFYTLEKKDRIKEIILEISSGDDLVLLGLKTNLTQEDLDQIIKSNN